MSLRKASNVSLCSQCHPKLPLIPNLGADTNSQDNDQASDAEIESEYQDSDFEEPEHDKQDPTDDPRKSGEQQANKKRQSKPKGEARRDLNGRLFYRENMHESWSRPLQCKVFQVRF